MWFIVWSPAWMFPAKTLVHENDPHAFMVIGQAQEALGEGFTPLKVDHH